MVNFEKYNEDLVASVKKYIVNIDNMTEDEFDKLAVDMTESMNQHNLGVFDEYFEYDFQNKTYDQRRKFAGNGALNAFCEKNTPENLVDNIRDKYKSYVIFKDIYKRDVICVNGFDDYAKFVEFVAKHKTYILKPIKGSQGLSIIKVSINENTSVKNEFFKALSYGGCVVEECIEQCDELAEYNHSSLNTIRIVTYNCGDEFFVVYAMFRTGRKDSIVDNASQGGIAAGVDTKTGIVFSNGYTKNLEEYEVHPDTGTKFKSSAIPRWDELLKIVEILHKRTDGFKIIGWDMALTPKGWVMVEANGRPKLSAIQLIMNKSFGVGLGDLLHPVFED